MKHKLITTSVILAFSLAGNLSAQEKPDPFVKGGKNRVQSPPENQHVKKNPTHTIVFETFSLPLKEAAALIRSGKTDEQIYATLVKSAKQEGLTVVRGRSGEKSSNESVHELIYPTEYEPAELPNSVGAQITSAEEKKEGTQAAAPQLGALSKAVNAKSFDGLVTPATPTAFETRNVGVNLEVEFTVPFDDEDGDLCDVRIYPEIVTFVGNRTWGQGVSKVEMVDMEAQRMNTGVSLRVGKPFLLGTMNRPPSSKVDGNLPNRIWFAMITLNAIPR